MPTDAAPNPPAPAEDPEWLALGRAHVQDLRFGVVQRVIHEGRVAQVERTEKTRLPSGREGHPPR